MLIDARHREETRVAVVKGNRIEEFDFESARRAQIKGNIYLAKITRVEPSLQAAFVDYGGNRHGFLAFSEIHPDYYQIPKSDREALLAEEREIAEAHAAELEAEKAKRSKARRDDDEEDDANDDEDDDDHDTEGDDHVDNAANEALRKKRQNLRRRYKIQEVIKRRQVLLVQVVKEERGNKGAALSTYLSLAGRYSVLMPNTSHGGGISRKIANGSDRKRLKSIVNELNLPSGMGVIVRTAGASRTKTEIKRDFDYLSRLWDEIRQKTLASTAPALIHEDSDLIKRAIRDLYTREIEEVLVDGAEGHKAAKGFMKLLMPSHARKVKLYDDPVPIYQRYRVEEQLSEMYLPTVRLKSGGYIVINPTEALVAIDINSGKSTREHNIEETAYKTNVEAAREVARQLKLRDMAGLIVIDFIDMDHGGNVRKVERALKDALKDDRARIQVGRISQFGLLEMSRQRLRTGVLEASTSTCPVCDGAGIVRTVESAGLGALREVEALALKGKNNDFSVHLPSDVAVYLVNEKRRSLANLEERYGIAVRINPEDEMHINEREVVARGGPPRPTVDISMPEGHDSEPDDSEDVTDNFDEEDEDERRERGRGRRRRGGRGRKGRDHRDEDSGDSESDDREPDEEANAQDGGRDKSEDDQKSEDTGGDKRGRRRRGRRGGRNRRKRQDDRPESQDGDAVTDATDDASADTQAAPEVEAAASLDVSEAVKDADAVQASEAPKKKRPARRKKKSEDTEDGTAEDAASGSKAPVEEADSDEPAAAKPKRTRRRKPKADAASEAEADKIDGQSPTAEEDTPKPRSKPKDAAPRPVPAPAPAAPASDAADDAAPAANDSQADSEDEPPKRKGWWQRTFGG
ncbi:ribonuclease E/G [Pacificimonas flava]|uniref:Ribonuclease E n=3 Tax=Sphingosinicellaceae TaxID=2820280 RepID=A0A219B8M3_9SPHN|nr:Rne/Rng family ribonuclease [Pacificimonas aurantium]OWV34715.1 ribonuclease E/G [Pacificimonas flava]